MELIRCFEVGGKAVPVSHLQYADDTILFLLAKKKWVSIVQHKIRCCVLV